MAQDKRCALDVNVLIDLAEQRDFALDFLGVVREKHCPFCLSPTAFIELELLIRDGGPQQQKAAKAAIASLHEWGVFVFNLKPVQHGCTKVFVQRLIQKGYLSEDEYNDGLILGEVGCFGVPLLVTSDDHLLGISPHAISAELKASDFFPTVVSSPQKIVRIASR
ncbi:MAG TPA: hypothetical protein VN578_20120 [Candidatus Binatia bacterium]|jgi:hypothetical protein|nr:hypothetical protein [Candidatus Binatia bacterium]